MRGWNGGYDMVSSLDGMIAKKDNSVSWFETSSHYEKGVVGEDAVEFLKTIDCYVMGARTYEHALELSRSYGWAHAGGGAVACRACGRNTNVRPAESIRGGYVVLRPPGTGAGVASERRDGLPKRDGGAKV